MSELPREDEGCVENPSFVDEHIFLIISKDPWHGNILVYLQIHGAPPYSTHKQRHKIRQQSKHYIIIGDTLYHRCVDTILRRFLVHEEAENVFNDCNGGLCGGHLSRLAISRKIFHTGYF